MSDATTTILPERPRKTEEQPVPPIPVVDEAKSDQASVQYSHFRTQLSTHRTGLSEHRTSLSEYRTDLSTHRTMLSTGRTEMSMRRTGMSFQRTRMSADRTLMSVIRTSLSLISFGFTIYQVFDKLRVAGAITHAMAPLNFGVALVLLGIALLIMGIAYHVQFMAGLRRERTAMATAGLVHAESGERVSAFDDLGHRIHPPADRPLCRLQHGLPGRALRLRRHQPVPCNASTSREPFMAQQPKKQNGKPNILVIWGDDIGISNLSCYSQGLMGYRTPNIDRLAREGMLFTDSYGEQSCTAGRSAFITGQSVYRTGLSKVGVPGAPVGMNEKLVTIAALLKEQGYATGQFGKNHLGDLNHMLPTNHGFDEFFGNLYHLNAEEEPEMDDYPSSKDFPHFREKFGPRGVMRSWATEEDDPTEEPRWGRVGKQKIEDTGPLTRKRMETCDDDFVAAAQDFIKRQEEAGKPWFVWLNTTHMHLYTHTKPESRGQAGRWQSGYHDTMVDHDRNVGQMLDFLDELGIAEDTFVQYSTDNGPHRNSWPDGGTTPFRSEKNTNWEGAFRVPLLVRWPGKIEAGSISNEIVQHHDWMPTFLAMAGAPDVVDKLKEGYQAIGRTYKNHIDGYNLLPYLTGEEEKSPRDFYFYFSDDGDVLAVRMDNWKITFMEQRTPGTLAVWRDPFTRLRAPVIYNLRTDPYEFGTVTSNTYNDWMMQHAFLIYAVQEVAGKFAETFREFPAVQKPNSFTIDDAMAKMSEAAAGD